MCCSGAIFIWLDLEGDEAERLAHLEPEERPDGEPVRVFLPCPALEGTLCSIYPERPATCRRYSCFLIEKADKGAVTIDEARSIIGEAQALFAALLEFRREGESVPELRRRALAEDAPPDLKFAGYAMEYAIDRHFRRGKQHKLDREEI